VTTQRCVGSSAHDGRKKLGIQIGQIQDDHFALRARHRGRHSVGRESQRPHDPDARLDHPAFLPGPRVPEAQEALVVISGRAFLIFSVLVNFFGIDGSREEPPVGGYRGDDLR
jgi:hypothetical protein